MTPDRVSLLDISIIVHGESPYIIPCLESILAGTHTPCRIHVVANTGENQSVQRVRISFPQVRIVVNERPRGFAANHNAVMAGTCGRYIALLNDDIIVEDGGLDTLVQFLENHPGAAIAGPRLLNPDGTLQPSTFGDPTYLKMLLKLLGLSGLLPPESPGRRVVERLLRPLFPHTLARYWEHDRVAEVQALKGAATVVRRAALETVGPMAEVTLAYGEEIDWHLRFRQAGWKLYLVPQARIVHYQEQTTGGQRGRMMIESRKSILYYFHRHRRKREWETLRWTVILTHVLRWTWTLLPSLRSRDWRERRAIHETILSIARKWPNGA